MKTTLKNNILRSLNSKSRENALLIRALERFPDTQTHCYENSAAVFEPQSSSWLFSLDKVSDFGSLYEMIDEPIGTFYVNNCFSLEEIKKYIPDAKGQRYVQYVIEKNGFKPNKAVVNSEIEVVPIDSTWVDFVLSLYKSPEFGHREYIERCIEVNPGFGALYHGTKVGYVLIHLDGEIGSMVISENARGKGVGCTLMQYITPVYADMASIGCGFVLPDNKKSQSMMEKSCFEPLDKMIMWVYH